ncbi:hypothetical protein QTP70_004069 [Hemibagrus guttatus]|uniref:Sushi, von Willebrand factor type A, EGF and pentraxin domain-containing protein 1 n=1 Tax=Hemibagrus guttatus TaxID=175788 RepID=A0AAE0R6Y3_9TELE|nr:hypothetical protein QTP70_004069 [Hemibagrus guttatus]
MAALRFSVTVWFSLVIWNLLRTSGSTVPSQSHRNISESAESKIERLGQTFRRNVRLLRERAGRLELVFLVDESSSVGATNFRSELHFIRKMLSDFPVASEATRVALITFSSKNHVLTRVDYISAPKAHQHKCALFNKEIPAITYRGGGTYTRGAFQRAAQILRSSRQNATKVIFLITDGYSNGGDPRPVAAVLRRSGVEIFTLGIWQGNIRELHDMASHPKDQHCYFVHNFDEFEALARRALHEEGRDCCDLMASCQCGIHTGQYDCVCEKGHYGKGLQLECTACPPGTYKPVALPGGVGTCLPCPDPQHTSRPGSTSVSDCVCNEGYTLHNHTCQAVVCAVLSPPDNGFFIQNTCNNQYNSACGVRCLPGFELQGSNIRLCQADGTWSGAPPTCTARSCPVLSAPQHGLLNCSTSVSSSQFECAVRCQKGFRLEGKAKLTCLPNSQWSSPPPRCVEVRCSPIVTLEQVRMSPPACGKRAMRPGAVCRFSCRRGYHLLGNPEVRCLATGEWSNNMHKVTCADAEPPWIQCPEDIITLTNKRQGSSNVTLSAPVLRDNSGNEVVVQVTPILSPAQPFPIGTEVITYTATDPAGNKANCSFTVTVIDMEPPLIDRCRSPPTIQATDTETPVYWDEPQFSDNSGAQLNISNTHSSGDTFPVGETAVYYTATDPSGNNRTCELIITVQGSTCEQPYVPVNANFSCIKEEKGVNCTLVCNEGYSLTQNAVHSYFCPNNGRWEPARTPDRPDCSQNRVANNGFKPFEMLFKASRCDDPDLLKSFTGDFTNILGDIVPKICGGDEVSCKLEVMTQGQCLEYNYDYPNGFAIGPGGWSSNGQDYAYFDSGFSPDHQRTHLQQDGVFHHSSHLRGKRHREITGPTRDQKIQIYFNITASIPLPLSRNDSVEVANQKRLLRTLELLTNRLKRTLSKQQLSRFHVSSEMIVADPKSLDSKKASLYCRPGSVLKGRMCVQCPVGTYFSADYAECESCRRGSYQDEEGQTECKLCPDGFSTPYLHSRSLSECRAQCKPGSSSLSGLETCESLPFGSVPAWFWLTFMFALPSENLHRQPRSHGAERVWRQGFTGESCEVNIDECYTAPCLNGGTCVDAVNDFRCDCVIGFSGKLCQVDKDECESNPCLNGATCKDEVGSYTCRCPPGFNGTRCETEMSSTFNLDFEVSGIHGYVMMDGMMPALTQITCTFWMRSSDTVNYGTPISYAVDGGSDNAFLLIDYNGWVLYVNGKERITDCPAVNDGRWHHIGVTWRNTDGDWRIYIDGSPSDGGKGLSIGRTIPGGGALVLGQDQDQRGEGFNPVESFVGSLSQLNIWDYVLSPQQIRSLSNSCPSDLQRGNVFAWPDFLHGITGRVKTNPKSMFCTDCPLLQDTVPNLRSSSPAVTPGTQVKFSCNPGYYLVGEPVQKCLNRGAWSHAQPRCERVNCGTPPALLHGQYHGEDFYAGSSVLYQCKPGFYLLGESRMQCGNNGKWSGNVPACLDMDECALGSDCDENASCQNTDGSYICTCIYPFTGDGRNCRALSCSPPTVPKHGLLEGTNFTYRSKVTFSCEKGYVLQGPTEIECQSDLKWSRVPPSCQPVTCSRPPAVDFADFSLNGNVYLSTLTYTCIKGYRLQGQGELKCEASGKWTSPAPVCARVNCGDPPPLKDAVVKGDNFTLGSQVHYICKEGYTLLGTETQECLPSGEWSREFSQCVPRSCGPPPPVDHAHPDTGHKLFGDTAIYFCDDGYTAGNSTKLFCNAEGIWAPPEGQSMPYCIATFCQRPPDLPHAILDSIYKPKYASNTEVSYKCEEGFMLNTTATLKCLMGGEWSPSPMDIGCVPIRCSKPENIERGYVSGTNYNFGAVIAYSCDKGYYIRGEKRRTCMANGEWGGVLPTCQPISCSTPPRLINGFIQDSTRRANYVYNSKVTYTCNVGYRLIGKADRSCMANKQWSNIDPPICKLLHCPQPPDILHGHYHGSIFEVGSKVEYVCDDGYELNGEAVWTCLKYGKWDKTKAPQCSPVQCLEPPLEENHLVLRSLDSNSGTVELSCEDGYVLHGAKILRCTPSQEWNDSFPVCKQVSCGPPPEVSFGDPSSTSTYFASVVTYSCMAGFTLRKEASVSCQADGHWSTPYPECIPVECPHPEEISNGIVDVQGLMFLSTALYSCKPGYDLVGNSTVICGQSGLWIGGVPACRPIECPPPKEISNGIAKFSRLLFSRSVTYTCQRGYSLKGPETLTCLENGKWDNEVPFCQQIYCLPPKPIDNGFVEGRDHKFGVTIFYSCFPGFLLVGQSHLTCEEHGWSSSVPTCTPADCGLPPHIDFGDYFKIQDPSAELTGDKPADTPSPADTSFLHGTMVEYRCHAGYEMNGRVALVCQEDGTWNGTAPKCVPAKCNTPPHPEHGSATVTDTVLGRLVEYSCDEGYELDGPTVQQCISGHQWSNEAPQCVPVNCGDPGGIANGEVIGSYFHFSGVIQYECHAGFVLQGSENRTCQMDGKWDGKAPWCKAVSCGRPVVPNDVLIKGDDYTFGKRLLFSCHNGFILHGTHTSVCLANGTWSENAPKCFPANCGRPPIIQNGRVIGTNYGYHGKVKYECNVGYTLAGKPTLVCGGDGLWDDPPPRCDIVTCDPPEDISHGFLNGSSFNFEDVVEYVCFPGYEAVGSPILRCAADGTWVGTVPECRLCICNPPVLRFGVVLGRDHTCGASVWFRCNEGYMLLGPTESVCDKGGLWSPGVPICSRGRCATPPPAVPNAVVQGGTVVPDEVTYECRQGYHLHGNPNLSCGRLGRWEVPSLHCDPVSCGEPPPVPNAEIVESVFTYGNKAKYRVIMFRSVRETELGVAVSLSVSNLTCQANGTWSSPAPTCEASKGCEKPEGLLNGKVQEQSLVSWKALEFFCNKGYTLQGESLVVCMGNGSWSSPFPVCTPHSCPPPPGLTGNNVNTTLFLVGQTVPINCPKGQQVKGRHGQSTAIITCRGDQTWTPIRAVCERVFCGPPLHMANGVVRGAVFQLGDVVVYSCFAGYIMEGTGRTVCWLQCQNGGVCQRPNICSCPEGWMGRFCEEPICILPCLNGGRCIAPYQCECPRGWTGKRCHAERTEKGWLNFLESLIAHSLLIFLKFNVIPSMCQSARCVHHHVRMEAGVSGPTGAAAVKVGVALIAPGVAEKYVRVVQDMYKRSRTVVRCAVGQTEEFKVEVGLHQGSALSPFLFAIVMDQLSEEVRQESPWAMMFADDIVICSESREQVEENLERWRFALERRGMKVSHSKTEYMCVNEREGSGTVRLQGEEVKKVHEFKYLGSTVQSNGECGKEVKKRVQAGWNGWRKVSGVLCDRKISARIKGKVYRTVVRPAMLYGLETVSLRKRQESELEVAELKMLRFSLGVTRLDRIRNEYIRGTAHVGCLGDKVREDRLRWFGHVQRRETCLCWPQKTPPPVNTGYEITESDRRNALSIPYNIDLLL